MAYRDLFLTAPAESSAAIRARVEAARLRQRRRFEGADGVYANAHMSVRDIRRFCPVSADVDELLRTAITRLSLSARANHRVLKIARTIADLAGEDDMGMPHVREA
ncbi:MAG TPA: magnesium chelatase, partial [Candidatus Acetothermia bacterium]|nr:magnesium chelatase [Candidatus Acetothermia bacterium]